MMSTTTFPPLSSKYSADCEPVSDPHPGHDSRESYRRRTNQIVKIAVLSDHNDCSYRGDKMGCILPVYSYRSLTALRYSKRDGKIVDRKLPIFSPLTGHFSFPKVIAYENLEIWTGWETRLTVHCGASIRVNGASRPWVSWVLRFLLAFRHETKKFDSLLPFFGCSMFCEACREPWVPVPAC